MLLIIIIKDGQGEMESDVNLGQPSSAKLRPMGRARPGVVGLSGVVWRVLNYDFMMMMMMMNQMQSEKTRLGMTGLLGQPSSAKLRPMGRARPSSVGLSD
jgi:hypothetical protein